MPEPLSATLASVKTESSARKRTMVAAICAVMMTALVFFGYTYLRNRHERKAAAAMPPTTPSQQAVGPHKVEIFVDEAMLDGDYTLIGGTVRNISSGTLSGLSLNLELKRRKASTTQNIAVQISPTQLAPQQDGSYSLRVPSAEYDTWRLLSLTTGADANLIAYGTSKGKKRPPERLEAKTIYVNRPPPAKGEFINTPDNPGRVP